MQRQSADDQQINLAYLEASLACLDLRLRRQVLRWQQAGQDPADPYRGLYITPGQAHAWLDRPFACPWGVQGSTDETDGPQSTERLAAERASERAAAQHCLGVQGQAQAAGITLRLDQMAAAFGLGELERAVFLIGLAAALDLRYGQVFAFLQDDVTRKLPSINLVLDLLAPLGATRLELLPHFTAEAPLFRHGLLRPTAELAAGSPSLTATFACDPVVLAWLLGQYSVEDAASGWLRVLETANSQPGMLEGDDGFSLTALPEDPVLAAALLNAALHTPAPLLVLEGPDLLAQEAAAMRVAGQLGRPLLVADLSGRELAAEPRPANLQRALRDARLLGAIAFLRLPSTGDAADSDTQATIPTWWRLLDHHPEPLFVGLPASPWWRPRRPLARFHFPLPDAAQRAALWQHCLGAAGDAGLSDAEIIAVAGRFPLSTAQVCAAAQSAGHQAAQEQGVVQASHLYAAARLHLAANLSGLAHKVPATAAWSDLVLPPLCVRQLREICGQLQHRSLVYERWGFAAKLTLGKGLTVLFAGPSGAGKTMAAGVLARELELDLYRIDLSMVVSKYIGETEKNLARIFDAAENGSAMLFFDEADALFGKRSAVRDAHDRYANVETSYLLQRLEEYNGLAILATNLRQNMDDAFVRRLHYIVEFPQPAAAERRRIWSQIWPASTPRAADLDLGFLAEQLEITGGVIRNAALRAAFLAAADGGVVKMAHVVAAVQGEYRKLGRILFEQDLGPYAHLLREDILQANA